MSMETGRTLRGVVSATLVATVVGACTTYEAPEPTPSEIASSGSADTTAVGCRTAVAYNGGRNFSAEPIVLWDEDAPEPARVVGAFEVNWGDGAARLITDGQAGVAHAYGKDGMFPLSITGTIVQGGESQHFDCGTAQIVAGDVDAADDGSVIGQPYFDVSGQSPHCEPIKFDTGAEYTVVDFTPLLLGKYGVNVSSVSVDWGEESTDMGGWSKFDEQMDAKMVYPTENVQPGSPVATVGYKNGSSVQCTPAQ